MKSHFIALLSLVLFFSGKKPQKKDVLYVLEIQKMGFGVHGIIAADCGRFKMHAPSHCYDTFFIKAGLQQNRILQWIRQAENYPQLKSIDTKAKIFLKYRSGHVDSLCLSMGEWFFYNGMGMQLRDRNLIKYLDSLPEINDRKYAEWSESNDADW